MINIKKIKKEDRPRKIKETMLLMGQHSNSPMLARLIKTLDLEAENLKDNEYYTSNELINFLERKQTMATNFKSAVKKDTTVKTVEKVKKETKAIYPKGIMIFEPNEKSPDFVKGKIVINLAMLQDWIEENPNLIHETEKYGNQIKLDLLQGEKGLYTKVDTYGLIL